MKLIFLFVLLPCLVLLLTATDFGDWMTARTSETCDFNFECVRIWEELVRSLSTLTSVLGTHQRFCMVVHVLHMMSSWDSLERVLEWKEPGLVV